MIPQRAQIIGAVPLVVFDQDDRLGLPDQGFPAAQRAELVIFHIELDQPDILQWQRIHPIAGGGFVRLFGRLGHVRPASDECAVGHVRFQADQPIRIRQGAIAQIYIVEPQRLRVQLGQNIVFQHRFKRIHPARALRIGVQHVAVKRACVNHRFAVGIGEDLGKVHMRERLVIAAFVSADQGGPVFGLGRHLQGDPVPQTRVGHGEFFVGDAEALHDISDARLCRLRVLHPYYPEAMTFVSG